MTTTMTTRTATRAASAAALALSALLALSACGGGDDTKDGSQAEGVGDNAGPQGVYINQSENRSNVVAIHDKDIAILGYDGETCDDFTTYFDAAKSGDFSTINNDDGDDDNDIASIEAGTLSDDQTKMIYPPDTGNDPKQVAVNTPDTGMISIGDTGNVYLPLDSEEGKAMYDVWETGQCG